MTRSETVSIDTGPGEVAGFDIHGLDRLAWAELLDEYPPRPDTTDTMWDEATFPPALVAACTDVPLERVQLWWDEATPDVSETVFGACLRLSNPGSIEWAIRRMRSTSRVEAEVRAATKVGIPRSEFLQWPTDDQDYVMAMLAVDADHCPGGCGATRSEMNNPTAYRVVRSKCMWCQQLEATRADQAEESRGHVHVTLVPTRET